MRQASEYLKKHYQELERDNGMPRSTKLAMKDLLLRSAFVALEMEEEKQQ